MNRLLPSLLLLACGDAGAQAIGGGAVGGGGGGAAADPAPVFSFAPQRNATGGSGVGNLSADAFGLTTVIDCDARDATATNLPCDTGGTFTESDGNPSTTLFAAPFTDVNSRAIEMIDDGYRAPNTTVGEVTATLDVSMTVVAFLTDRGATQYIAGKYDTVNSQGYAIRVTAGGVLQGVANATTFGSYTLPARGEWNIITLTCSQDTCSLYVNGKVTGSTGARSGTLATVTSAKNFSIGCRPNGTSNDCIDGFVSNVIVRTGAGLVVNASVAATNLQLAHELMGVWPANGTTKAPVQATRSTAKHCDIIRDDDAQYKAPSRLFYVGIDWLCVGRRQEVSADGLDIREGRHVVGYFDERTNTNLILQSEAFNTTWVKLTAADTTNANPGTRGPNQRTNEVDWVQAAADVVGLEHGFRQTSVALTAAKTYNFSVYVARIADDGINWVWLRDNTVANAHAFFNTQYCYVGTTGAGLRDMGSIMNGGRIGSARVTNVGRMETGEPDWCRIEISITGTAATHDFDIGSATADNDFTHTTTASQRVLMLWGAQLEVVNTSDQYGGVRASSYIPTTTVSVAKSADRLQFNENNWPDAGGMIVGASLLPDSRVSSAVHDYTTSSNDSTAPCVVEKDANNFLGAIYTGEVDTVKWGMQVSIFTAGTNQWSYTPDGLVPGWYDTHNGRLHWTRTVIMPNDARIYVDGQPDPSGTDTSITLPTIDSGAVSIGFMDGLGAYWNQGLVVECSIYSEEWEAHAP